MSLIQGFIQRIGFNRLKYHSVSWLISFAGNFIIINEVLLQYLIVSCLTRNMCAIMQIYCRIKSLFAKVVIQLYSPDVVYTRLSAQTTVKMYL
jgi:hypothetical protein